MADLLSVYHRLPYPLKVIAASMKGYQFAATRYDRETDNLVEEALARESWTSERWTSWQGESLARMLHHAAKNVPYYREKWAARRRSGDRASLEDLENWPVLHKQELRSHLNSFLADGYNRRQLIPNETSGTSGIPMTLWVTPTALRTWYALFETRWRRWYGLSRHDRWGILGGQLVTPYAQTRPPFWVWNAGMNQLYLSSFHISSQFASAYVQAIRKHRLVYLLGWASSLYEIARFAIEQRLEIPTLKAVLSNAEPLYPYQRDTIRLAFKCPVIDTYGQAENVCAASECAEGNLHLWPEVGRTEILSDESDQPVSTGQIGRLVATGLLNQAMPLIRYDFGDRASYSRQQSICSCKRTLPALGSIDGRIEDIIVTRDGRRLEGPANVFQESWPIWGAQIIQETLDRIRVCIVPAPRFDKNCEKLLISGLHDRVGDMEIVIEQVTEIPRSKSGKRKVIVSHVDKHD
jgi:phenylacetate-CoA ligase